MGYPHPEFSGRVLSSPHPMSAPRNDKGKSARFVSAMLAMLLAVTMLPVAGLQVAYADEPVERPATTGGDVALKGSLAVEASGGEAASVMGAEAGNVAGDGTTEAVAEGSVADETPTPVAEEREDGVLAADGLMYTVADGGLALVGFDGASPEGALAVPAAVLVDGKETPVVAIDLAEGQAADKVVVLSLSQSIKDIDTATLASAFPALLSVEVASASSTLPVAAGAASVRSAYSASGGMLFRPTTVTMQADDGSIESIECKELVWAPPALVSARIPVECRAVAEGAFASVRDLKTVVAFGTMERIADGAFSTEQMEAAKVVVPQASAAVTDGERVSASMALMGDAGQKERRSAWHEAGWRTDDIVMGKPYGSLTEAVAVADEGQIERDELQLVSYPGAHENAMDLKKPNAEGVIEQAENGLAFTVKSDMTAIVTWQGDKTATPSHLDIPATVVIDGVTYPVTEIAPNAFEGAAFLTSVTIPEGITAIGQDAFKDCPNLTGISIPSTMRRSTAAVSDEGSGLANEAASSFSPDGEERYSLLGNGGSGSTEEESEAAGFSEDEMSFFTTSNSKLRIVISPGLGESISVNWSPNATAVVAPSEITVTLANGLIGYWSTMRQGTNSCQFYFRNTHGASQASVSLSAPVGWVFAGAGVSGVSTGSDASTGEEYAWLALMRSETIGGSPLLSTAVASSTYALRSVVGEGGSLPASGYSTIDAGLKSLKDSKLDKSAVSSYDTNTKLDTKFNAKLDSSAISSYDTNAKLDAKFDTKVDASDFGTISYGGLDGSDASVYPTSYRKGGTPALPAPTREGFRFAGWSWSRGGASGDQSDIASAFAEADAVTLTANWGEPATPEAKHFFTSDAPLRHDDASATQTHVIKVRLASSPGTLASVSFEGDDRTGLLRETSGVRLFVGTSEDALASGTELSWGGATPSGWECELAKLGEGSYGVYVGVSIPTSAIDEASIPVSYADGSYVASLVKMNYAFA